MNWNPSSSLNFLNLHFFFHTKMSYRFDQDKSNMGRRKSFDLGNANGRNKCVVFPSKVSLAAEGFERKNLTLSVRSNVASDLIIQVEESIFELHKVPMVSKSAYLNRLVFKRISIGEKNPVSKIQLDNFPGGVKIFELVVKFCYGWKIELTASNIAPLYCAANFLEMSDDLEKGNLFSKTETFLSYILFSSWKDIFRILKSCETISSMAKELQIVKRCCEAIAWKASLDPKHVNEAENSRVADNWWVEDLSVLRIDHFLEVVEYVKRKGMRSDIVGSSIAYWTKKWVSKIPFGQSNLPKELTHKLLKVTAESLVKLLPDEKNSVSCNFLLHLLKLGNATRISPELLKKLEERIVLMLETCSASDLLVRNYGSKESIYDVGIVMKVLEGYIASVSNKSASRIFAVAKLLDGFLTMIARDSKLSVQNFQLLAEMLPKNARYCNDNLYRAIDMYLKEHPNLTEEERTSVCKTMDYNKLSIEARQHAMKNDRLPSHISMRLILLEQVTMTESMTAAGSDYRRTKAQSIIRIGKGFTAGCITAQKEIKIMKKEVEHMKVQLNALQKCKRLLQRQVKGCTI